MPSIQHNLIDSGRCKMYKRATSKEQAFLRLFHMHFSIHSLTIQTSLSLQNGNITVVWNKYTIVHDCHNGTKTMGFTVLGRTISRKQCVWYVCVYIYQVQLLSYDNNQKLLLLTWKAIRFIFTTRRENNSEKKTKLNGFIQVLVIN